MRRNKKRKRTIFGGGQEELFSEKEAERIVDVIEIFVKC